MIHHICAGSIYLANNDVEIYLLFFSRLFLHVYVVWFAFLCWAECMLLQQSVCNKSKSKPKNGNLTCTGNLDSKFGLRDTVCIAFTQAKHTLSGCALLAQGNIGRSHRCLHQTRSVEKRSERTRRPGWEPNKLNHRVDVRRQRARGNYSNTSFNCMNLMITCGYKMNRSLSRSHWWGVFIRLSFALFYFIFFFVVFFWLPLIVYNYDYVSRQWVHDVFSLRCSFVLVLAFPALAHERRDRTMDAISLIVAVAELHWATDS